MNANTQKLEERFQILIARAEAALDALDGQKLPRLGDLDRQAALLCEDVRKAGPETARAIQPLLAKMIGTLDRMASSLAEYQQQLRERQK